MRFVRPSGYIGIGPGGLVLLALLDLLGLSLGEVQLLGLLDQLVQIGLTQGARLFVDLLAVLEDGQGGDGLDAGGRSQVLVLVDVHLAEDGVGVLLTGLVVDGAESLAGAAPGSPEVNEDQVVLLDGLVDVRGSQFCCRHDDAFLGSRKDKASLSVRREIRRKEIPLAQGTTGSRRE